MSNSGEEIDQEALANFVSDNGIKQHECSDYVRDLKSETNNCMCGRSQEWHKENKIDVHKHNNSNTKTCTTNSFGNIEFQDFGQETLVSPYIRLSPDIKLATVWTLLTNHWKIPIPKFLISITGGAQEFFFTPELKAVFIRGLINAATSTGAWIITGGIAAGVTKLIGDAVRKHRITSTSTTDEIVALGIVPWGCIANRDALDGDGKRRLFPATYSLEDVPEIKDNKVPLDRNHTHFILVDNDSDGKFGAEIEFRSAFEQFVSEKVVAQSQREKTPVVLIVVGGEINTIKTVYESIQKNIPVLVFRYSGPAANFIAAGYDMTKDLNNEDISVYSANFDEEMMLVGRMMIGWKQSGNNIKGYIKQLKAILENRKLVNIFNLFEGKTKDNDRAMLYALIKAYKTSASDQLSLAIAWNRCDIARHEIFTNENTRHYWREHHTDLNKAMCSALVQDRLDFVQLFLENGVSLKKFLSIDTLRNLYGNVLLRSSDAMAQMLNNLIDLRYFRQTCTASHEHGVESTAKDPKLLYIIGKLMVHLLKDENFNFYKDCMKPKKGQKDDFGINAERELFLWAILFNRRHFAKLLWRVGQDQLGAALTACVLLKRLSSVADDEEELELSQDLMDHSNMYRDMAVGVLSECYKTDKMMAHQCLVRKLELYGKTTLFALADTHKLMEFMGHTCCHTKLNIIWKGRMAPSTPTLKILLCVFFPFMVPTIKFTTNDRLLGDRLLGDRLLGDYDIDKPNEDVQDKVSPEVPSDDGDVFAHSNTGRKNKKKVYRVQMCGDFRTNTISISNALYCFYTAPVSVFVVNTISYLIFLGFFTYFVLTDLYPDHLSVVEGIVLGWTITMMIEEIRQVISNDRISLYNKVNGWFGSIWNRFDLAMYMIFSISVILRLTLTDTNFTYCRTCYSITVAMFYLRFMQVLFAEKNCGPKVIMITNMLIDLVLFLCIFLFFLLSFGIMYQANLFPNSPPSWYLLKSILYMPYWQMYGELFLHQLEGESLDTCTNNESIWRPAGGRDRCPENNALVPLLGAVYLLLTHILLVNLLIAMLSYSFQMVQKRSESVWRFHRYSLVHEFYYRPKFCPPFIILSHINRSILHICRCILKLNCLRHGYNVENKEYHDEFKLNLTEKDNNRLTLFVRSAADNYFIESQKAAQKAQKEELGTKVADTSNGIKTDVEKLSVENLVYRSPIWNIPDTDTDTDTDIDIDPPHTSGIKTYKLYSSEPCLHYTSDSISHTSQTSRIKTDKPYSSEPCLHYTSDNISHTSQSSRIETDMEEYSKDEREFSGPAPMNNISDTESDKPVLNDTDTDTDADIDLNKDHMFNTSLTPRSSNEEKEQLNELGDQDSQTTRL